jgi:hypothetical protein
MAKDNRILFQADIGLQVSFCRTRGNKLISLAPGRSFVQQAIMWINCSISMRSDTVLRANIKGLYQVEMANSGVR